MKKLLAVCLTLLLALSFAPASAEKTQDFAIVGEWMWASSIYDAGAQGAETLFNRAAQMGVTDVYLLVKGTLGTVSFNKTETALKKAHEDRDLLQEAIDAAHAHGIRLHAWLTSSNDAAYKEQFPEAGLWHYTRGRDNNVIDMTDAGFVAYMEKVVGEMCANYDIDGMHLDYIRYNHLCNGWSEEDLAALAARGANVEHLKEMMVKTFYAEDKDDHFIFDALNHGDADAKILADYRRDNVVNFAEKMIAAARAQKPDLIVTAAMMPDGAASLTDTAFADLHYGQRYADAAALYDYILPMAYGLDYAQDSQWVAAVAQNAVTMGNKVVCGLQAYYPATSENLMNDVAALRALLPGSEGGLLGVALFRTTTYQYAKITTADHKMTIRVFNAQPETTLSKIEIALAEGLKATDAAAIDGFADASITVSEDGATVTLAAEALLAGDAEGTLAITFEGLAPAVPALVRPFGENETRAYHVYD